MQPAYSYAPSPHAAPSVDVAAFMNRVYRWMAAGLVLTGVVAALVDSSLDLQRAIFGNRLLFSGLLIGQLIMVVVFSRSVTRVSAGTGAAMFVSYCALTGLTFSIYGIVYTSESIAVALYGTGGMFAVMSAYGTLTKKDLSSWGNLLMMALVGIIVAGLLNLFFQSSMMSFVISAVGVVVFTGLTAYDTQKIRGMAESGDNRLALVGALMLYLDFLNLFVSLLRLFGRRR